MRMRNSLQSRQQLPLACRQLPDIQRARAAPTGFNPTRPSDRSAYEHADALHTVEFAESRPAVLGRAAGRSGSRRSPGLDLTSPFRLSCAALRSSRLVGSRSRSSAAIKALLAQRPQALAFVLAQLHGQDLRRPNLPVQELDPVAAPAGCGPPRTGAAPARPGGSSAPWPRSPRRRRRPAPSARPAPLRSWTFSSQRAPKRALSSSTSQCRMEFAA